MTKEGDNQSNKIVRFEEYHKRRESLPAKPVPKKLVRYTRPELPPSQSDTTAEQEAERVYNETYTEYNKRVAEESAKTYTKEELLDLARRVVPISPKDAEVLGSIYEHHINILAEKMARNPGLRLDYLDSLNDDADKSHEHP